MQFVVVTVGWFSGRKMKPQWFFLLSFCLSQKSVGEMGLPGLNVCNYALKSAAGVNSLPSQLTLVARTLCLHQLDARRQGLQTCMHTGSSQQTSQCYRLKELGSQSPPFFFMQTTKTSGWVYAKKRCLQTYVEQAHINTRESTHTNMLLKHPPTLLWAGISASSLRFYVKVGEYKWP